MSGSFQLLSRVPSRTGHAPVSRKCVTYRCSRCNERHVISDISAGKTGYLGGTIIFGDSFLRATSNTPDTGGVNWTGWNSLTFKDGKRFNLFYTAPARNIIAHGSRTVVLFNISIFTFAYNDHMLSIAYPVYHPVTYTIFGNRWSKCYKFIWFLSSLKIIIFVRFFLLMRYVLDCRIERMT